MTSKITVGLTETQVKAQLAEEEDEEAANGNPSLHSVTPSSMVTELLEIEDLQYVSHCYDVHRL